MASSWVRTRLMNSRKSNTPLRSLSALQIISSITAGGMLESAFLSTRRSSGRGIVPSWSLSSYTSTTKTLEPQNQCASKRVTLTWSKMGFHFWSKALKRKRNLKVRNGQLETKRKNSPGLLLAGCSSRYPFRRDWDRAGYLPAHSACWHWMNASL